MFRARSFLFFRVCIFIAFWCRVHPGTSGRFSSSQIIQIIQIGREGGRVCLFSQVLLIRFLFNGIGRTGWTGHFSFRLTNRSKLQRIRMRPIFWLSAVLHRRSCPVPMHTSGLLHHVCTLLHIQDVLLIKLCLLDRSLSKLCLRLQGPCFF